MPLRHLLFRCPACGQDPVHGERDLVSCPACAARFTRGEGAAIRVAGTDRFEGDVSAWELAERIEAMGGALAAAERPDGTFRYESDAERRRVSGEVAVRDRGRVMGFAETLGPPVSGRLTVNDEAIWFRPDGSEVVDRIGLLDVRSIQAASSSLQLRSGDGETVAFRFPSDSPRRWELLLRHLVGRAWTGAGRGEVVEYQPCVVTAGSAASERPERDLVAAVRRRGWTPPRWGLGYRAARIVARLGLRARLDLRVAGADHVPADGPFVLAVSHRSFLDPVLVLSVCPRPLHTLAKSTQFASRGWQRLLLRLLAFPTRRYRVDAQAVRTSLRVLAAGRGLGIFPEGERSWDGRPQPLRRGAVRLLLAADVPVIPCAVVGSYDVLPRWSRSVARGRSVVVRFGAPVALAGTAGAGEEGGDAVSVAAGRLGRALERLESGSVEERT